MFPAVLKELTLLPKDIRNPKSKVKAKRDSKPLGRGSFPEGERNLPVQAVSEHLRFNHPAQTDSLVDKLLPQKKSSFNVQGRLTDDNLRQLERNLRVGLSSLSYALWCLEFSSDSLQQISEDAEGEELFMPIISSIKHSMSFLSSVLDRTAISFATSVLVRRDSYLAQMDQLVPDEDLVKLRAAGFLDPNLFAGNIPEILPKLDDLRKESQSRQSVDAIASLAKKGVDSSKTSTTSSSNPQKKQSKKSFKKKNYFKRNPGAGNNTKSSDQASSNYNKGSFRGKGKKSGNK